MQVPLEHKEIVHLPRIIPQERSIQMQVEATSEVPIPMTQEETFDWFTVVNQQCTTHEELVQVAAIVYQQCTHHFQEVIADTLATQDLEKLDHLPNIGPEERII